MDPFLLGVLAGYGIAIPVGAIAVLIVQTGMRCGFRCAVAAGAGAATADLAYSVLAVTGGATLSVLITSIQQPVRWASAGILATIALVGLLRARRQPTTNQAIALVGTNHAGTYGRFLTLTIVNPLTVLYFVAVVVGSGLATGLTPVQGAVFAAGAFLASLSWQVGLATVGSLARHMMSARVRAGATVAGHVTVLAMAVLVVVR